MAGSVIFSLGTSPLFTLTNDLIIGSVAPERAGAAAGISETAAEFGGAAGVAVFGSIGVAIYRGSFEIPNRVPSDLANVARDTLGGALEIASDLPVDVATALIAAARAAFTTGLQVAAAISALGSVALAVFAFLAFRSQRGSEDGDEDFHEAATQ